MSGADDPMPGLQMVGETDLHRKVRKQKLPIYFDCISPGDSFVDLETVKRIIGDVNLTEANVPARLGGRLHPVVAPRPYPCVVATIEKNRQTVRVYDSGTTCEQVLADLGVPEGMTCLLLKTASAARSSGQMTPFTLDDIDFSRTSSYLTITSPLPAITTDLITVAVILPAAPAYYFVRNCVRSYTDRRVGPAYVLVPYYPEVEEMRTYLAEYLSSYTEHALIPDVNVMLRDVEESPTSRICKRGVCTVSLTHGNTVRKDSLAFEILPGAGASAILDVITEHVRSVSIMESQYFDFDTSFTNFIQQACVQTNQKAYKMWVSPETGHASLGVFIDGADTARLAKFAFFPNRPDMLPVTPKAMYDMETDILKRSLKSLLGSWNMSQHGLGNFLNAMANSENRYHLQPHASYAEMVDESVTTINETSWLYEFQKETVRDMIRHETCADGTASLYGTRLSGDAFGHGVFMLQHHHICKYVPPPLTQDLRRTMGILADQPGMGKTRQCVSLIRATGNRATSATLVIVQPSIIQQWRNEILAVWPEADVYMYYGPRKSPAGLEHAAVNADIILTTASTLTSNIGVFIDKSWFRIIMDESQTIPNLLVRGIQLNVQHKWCVTGTPDVNLRRQIIWLFQDSLWMALNYQAWNLSQNDCTDPGMLWRLLRPILFRKTRDMHLDLPEVHEHTVSVELSSQERARYSETAVSMRNAHPDGVYLMTQATRYYNIMQALATMGQAADEVLSLDGGGGACTSAVFSTARFIEHEEEIPTDDVCPICLDAFEDVCRTACNHFFCTECLSIHVGTSAHCPLCRQRIESSSVTKRPPAPAPDQPDMMETEENETVLSSKAVQMVEDIQRILAADHASKVLVFFPHVYMLTWFKDVLSKRANIDCLTVSGKDSVTRRAKYFSLFQTSRDSAHRVMLMTTRCAAAGITLTQADHVMTVTPCMQKSLEHQIIGRANRIGRGSRPVHFYRYVAADTVESLLVRTYSENETRGVHARIVNTTIQQQFPSM